MKNQSGKAGEEHIARWLESQGYEILARNFHSRYGRLTSSPSGPHTLPLWR